MKPMPPWNELVRMRVVHRVPGQESLPARRHAYKSAGGTALELDAYARPGAPPRPAVLLIHGGPVPAGSSPKDMGVFASWAELLVASGLAAVVFNHRFHGPESLRDAAEDVSDAIAFAREHAPELGLDPERLALFAFSGGGPFLSLALRTRERAVRALVAYYAALDLREKPPGAPDTLSPETRQELSPAHYVESGREVPPMLVARAGLDHPFLNATVDRFVKAALDRNAPLTLLNHPEGRHGFDVLDDDARTHEIVETTLRFLALHLGR